MELNSIKMGKIISESLDYAKTIKKGIKLEQINLYDCINNSYIDIEDIQNKNVKLIFDVDQSFFINADPILLYRLFHPLTPSAFPGVSLVPFVGHEVLHGGEQK